MGDGTFLSASAANTMALGALTNASGASFAVFGSASHPATLAFTGAGFSQNDGTFQLFNTTPLTVNNAFTNSSTGTFQLGGTSAVTVTGNYTNGGALDVDVGSGDGGGNLTVGGTLANTKTVQMGDGTFLSAGAANTMTVGGLNNMSAGTVSVFGSSANQAKFNVTGGMASNSGDLEVHENVAVTTAAGVNLTNNGTFNIDTGSGQGASTTTIGGTLSNTATLNIGNTALSAPTAVTAAALTTPAQ